MEDRKAISITVVIPLYNKRATIATAIESVLAQTLREFDLIVVDDGSSDGGADIVRSFDDPRVNLIVQKNGGASRARNRGVETAKGNWIAFLDADDRYEPHFLELVSRAAQKEEVAVAVFSNLRLDEKDGPRLAMQPSEENILIEDYPAWFVSHRGRGFSSSSCLVRKSALLASGAFPEGVRSGEDTDTWFRLAWEGPVVYVGQCLAVYELRAAGSLSRTSGSVYPLVCKTIDERIADGRLKGDRARSARRARRFLVQDYAVSLALYGRRREAAHVLFSTPPTFFTMRKWTRGLFALLFRR